MSGFKFSAFLFLVGILLEWKIYVPWFRKSNTLSWRINKSSHPCTLFMDRILTSLHHAKLLLPPPLLAPLDSWLHLIFPNFILLLHHLPLPFPISTFCCWPPFPFPWSWTFRKQNSHWFTNKTKEAMKYLLAPWQYSYFIM